MATEALKLQALLLFLRIFVAFMQRTFIYF